MFNVAVVKLKDVVKYLVSIVIVLIVVMYFTRYFSDKKIQDVNYKKNHISNILLEDNWSFCIDEIIPGIKTINKELKDEEELIKEETVLGKLLKVELSMFNYKPNTIDDNVYGKEEVTENKESVISINEIKTGVDTEIVTKEPLVDAYNVMCDSVKIKNETSYELNKELLRQKPEINNKDIIIFHTHTCESYTSSEKYPYEPTGNFRTTDNNYSVVRVGDELTNYLTQYGYNVIHNKDYHDYPAYTGSYNRSLNTVEGILQKTSSDIIIDLHRDAIGSNSQYAPTVRIGEECAAQLMFVIGTNGGGLWHPNWNSNLQFAVQVQQKANEMYPGLFKPIILRNSRYNQHLGKAACIIEVGATGNTLEECLISMKYLSKVLNEIK